MADEVEAAVAYTVWKLTGSRTFESAYKGRALGLFILFEHRLW
jgi:hypothetical protein